VCVYVCVYGEHRQVVTRCILSKFSPAALEHASQQVKGKQAQIDTDLLGLQTGGEASCPISLGVLVRSHPLLTRLDIAHTDSQTDEAATVLRLLYIMDARELQDWVNEQLVFVQDHTVSI
jgi:hypothetical protein